MRLLCLILGLSLLAVSDAAAQFCATNTTGPLFLYSPLYYRAGQNLALDFGCFYSYPEAPIDDCRWEITQVTPKAPLAFSSEFFRDVIQPPRPGARSLCFLAGDDGSDGFCAGAAATGSPCTVGGNIQAVSLFLGGGGSPETVIVQLMLEPNFIPLPLTSGATGRWTGEWVPTSPARVTIHRTTLLRGPAGESRKMETTEVVHADGRGTHRLDRGDLVIVSRAGAPSPRILDRRTGRISELVATPALAQPRAGAPVAQVASGRVLKRENLGERTIAGVLAVGTRVSYEWPNLTRKNAPPFASTREVWVSADGRILEETAWNGANQQTEILTYAYEFLPSVPDALFDLDREAH